MKRCYELYIEEEPTGRYAWMTPRQVKRQNELMREGSGLRHSYRLAPEYVSDEYVMAAQ